MTSKPEPSADAGLSASDRLPPGATVVIQAAVDWSFIAQAQQLLARRMAKRGYNVVFVEPFPHRYPGIGEMSKTLARIRRALRPAGPSSTGEEDGRLPDGLSVVSTVGFPETNRLFRWINRKLFVPWLGRKIRRLCTEPIVVQCWKPLDAYLALARHLEPDVLMYSCIENYPYQYTGHPHYESVEDDLLEESDVVVANAEYVADRLREARPDVLLRDAAVDFELFDRAATGPGSEYRRLCFFGAISDRLDFDILLGLAEAGYEVLLLGPVRRAPIDPEHPPENMRCHPAVPIEEVPDIIANSDCILLPYVVDEYNKGSRFAKLYECFATGKPIVATPIPTLKRFPGLVHLADDLGGFLDLLDRLPELEDDSTYRERREIARQNEWERRVDEELAWMARALENGFRRESRARNRA